MKNQVVEYDITTAEIEKLKDSFKDIPSLDTKENYEFVRKGISHLRKLRSSLESKRKELKADSLAWGRLVDSKAKEIKAELEGIENPMIEAKKAHDDKIEAEKEAIRKAKQDRIDGINARILNFQSTVTNSINLSSEVIIKNLSKIEETEIDGSFEEFKVIAEREKESSIATLKEMIIHAEKAEETARDLARIQAEQEAERKALEEKRKVEEAEIEAKRAAFQAEQEADRKAQAEKRRIEDEELAKQRAEIEAEREKIRLQKEAEQLNREEEEREAERIRVEQENQMLQKEFEQQTIDALARLLNEIDAEKVFKAIKLGNIPHISFKPHG